MVAVRVGNRWCGVFNVKKGFCWGKAYQFCAYCIVEDLSAGPVGQASLDTYKSHLTLYSPPTSSQHQPPPPTTTTIQPTSPTLHCLQRIPITIWCNTETAKMPFVCLCPDCVQTPHLAYNPIFKFFSMKQWHNMLLRHTGQLCPTVVTVM